MLPALQIKDLINFIFRHSARIWRTLGTKHARLLPEIQFVLNIPDIVKDIRNILTDKLLKNNNDASQNTTEWNTDTRLAPVLLF